MAASHNLQRKLQQVLGAEPAGELLARVDVMDSHRGDIAELRGEMQVGFAKIMDAHRGDIAELRREMQVGFAKIDERFARVDGRIDTMQANTETMQASLERVMEKGLREQTRFFFLAWSMLLAAMIGLYAR